MQEFGQQLINGISLGSIYALIALGYTMVYGIIRLINFAHGEIYMLGAYMGFVATRHLNLPFIPALLFSMITCGIIGIIIERFAYRPLRNSPRIAALITAIGLSFFLSNTTMWVASPQTRTYPQILANAQYRFAGLILSSQQVLLLLVSISLMAFLQYIVYHTKTGKAMRAVSMDREAAGLMGIDVDRIICYTFALGSSLAGAAGVLVAIYYNRIDPLMGIMPGLKAFVAAVLGGIGIIPGAMLGGMLMGIAESLVSGFLSSTFRDAVAFGILIIVLLVRPVGLLGKNVREKV